MALFGNKLRTPQFARRRRKIFFLKVGVFVFLLGAVFTSVVYVSKLNVMLIQNIVIEGEETTNESEILTLVREKLAGNYLFLFPKANIFVHPRGSLEASVLSSFKKLKAVDVSIGDANTLTLTVVERLPQALWCGENRVPNPDAIRCFFIDPAGYVYAEAPAFTGDVYVRFFGPIGQGEPIGQTFLSEGRFSSLLEFFERLKQNSIVGTEVAIIDGEYELYLAEGTKVLFKAEDQLPRVLDNLLSVFSSNTFGEREHLNLDYIDLRFGNKVFYKERPPSL